MISRLSEITRPRDIACMRPDRDALRARAEAARGRAADLASTGLGLADDVAGQGRRRLHDAFDVVAPVVRRAMEDADVGAAIRRAAEPAAALARRRAWRRRRRLIVAGAAVAFIAAVGAALALRARRAQADEDEIPQPGHDRGAEPENDGSPSAG